jgi:hypothetical protein
LPRGVGKSTVASSTESSGDWVTMRSDEDQ